jgi:hypothetical protein
MNTFLIALYVMVDGFCKSQFPTEQQPGPKASLMRSEVVTLVARMALHNFCIWVNKHLGRDPFALADLLGW